MSTHLIQVKNIQKQFTTGEVVTKVLYGVSCVIETGEFVAIMGPSGSGKSTLMHILGMLDMPSSGNYLFKGKDVTGFTDAQLAQLRNEELGFVFQAFYLLPKVSVLENVMLPLEYSSQRSNAKQLATEALTAVGLSHRIDYQPNQLSGGEKQRVAIARALVNKPSVVFADEPTGNLDSKSGLAVMSILQQLNDQGTTVILVTHETYTSRHAKRIISLRDGLIETDIPVKDRIIATQESELHK